MPSFTALAGRTTAGFAPALAFASMRLKLMRRRAVRTLKLFCGFACLLLVSYKPLAAKYFWRAKKQRAATCTGVEAAQDTPTDRLKPPNGRPAQSTELPGHSGSGSRRRGPDLQQQNQRRCHTEGLPLRKLERRRGAGQRRGRRRGPARRRHKRSSHVPGRFWKLPCAIRGGNETDTLR